MLDFTKLRTKALIMGTLLAFGSSAAFAQQFGSAEADGSPIVGPKITLWNEGAVQLPISKEGKVPAGVYAAYKKTGEAWQAMKAYGAKPTANPATSGYWIDDSKLYVFAGETNEASVAFDFSTKYLNDVKNLNFTLAGYDFSEAGNGIASNMYNIYTITAKVFDLDGTALKYGDVYEGAGDVTIAFEQKSVQLDWGHKEGFQKALEAAGYTDIHFTLSEDQQGAEDWEPFYDITATKTVAQDKELVVEKIFLTNELSKTVKFFQEADDEFEDHKFIPGALDNKIIRLTLESGVAQKDDNQNDDAHFPRALVLSGMSLEFETPTLALEAADAGMFEAGICFKDEDGDGVAGNNNVTITTNLTDAKFNLGVATGFSFDLLEGELSVKPISDAVAGKEYPYVFTPKTIYPSGTTAQFAASLNNTDDNLSPVKISAKSNSVEYNSTPEVTLGTTRVSFTETRDQEVVSILGKNIPDCNYHFEGFFYKDNDWSQTAKVKVDNNFEIDETGKIIGENPNLTIKFKEILNNIDGKVVNGTVQVCPDLSICEANTYTAWKELDFMKKSIQVIGDVAAVWFEYAGDADNKVVPTLVGKDISTAFYAPYDSDLLPEDQAVSRTKVFMLKGTKIKNIDSNDKAYFSVEVLRSAVHGDRDDHQEFRYSIDGKKWFTPAKNAVIEVTLATAQDVENFKTVGVPVYVQFKPNCTGFEDVEGAIKDWEPHNCFLGAIQIVDPEGDNEEYIDKVAALAWMFGDTRANVKTNIHAWQPVPEMLNSVQTSYTWLTQSDFRKNFGSTYLGSCDEQGNPLKLDSFYVAAYNVIDPIEVTYSDDYTDYDPYKVTVVAREGYGSADEMKLIPNAFGEVMAKVYVEYAPSKKVNRTDKAYLDIEYDGRTMVNRADSWFDWEEFNYPDVVGDSYFWYPNFRCRKAVVEGDVYKPTITLTSGTIQDAKVAIKGNNTQTVTVEGTDLDPNKKVVNFSIITDEKTPFSLTGNKDVAINRDGTMSATMTLKFAPTKETMCNNIISDLRYAYGSCTNSLNEAAKCEEAEFVTVVGQPTFDAFKPGDLQGDRAKVVANAADGCDNFTVGIGVMKYTKTTQSIIMSEVYANTNKMYIELFNGTGRELNNEIDAQGTPNYYLKVYEIKDGVSEQVGNDRPILKSVLAGGDLWQPYGTAILAIDGLNLAQGNDYQVELWQGLIHMDTYKFTGTVTHKTRKDELAADAYTKVTAFNEADWTTVGGWDTSIDANDQVALFAQNFHDGLAGKYNEAAFKQYMDNKEVEKAEFGFGKAVEISGLKAEEVYTLYAFSNVPCEDAVVVETHPTYKVLPTSDSEFKGGDPMEFVKFGFATGNEQISTSEQAVIGGKGNVTILNAAGKNVVITNVLGQVVARTAITSDNATVSVPAGVVVVTLDEDTVKAIVK